MSHLKKLPQKVFVNEFMPKTINEYFDILGSSITKDTNNNNIITNIDRSHWGKYNTAYGVSIISGINMIHYFSQFKINQCNKMYIGVECDEWNLSNTNFADKNHNKDGEYCTYCNNGKRYSSNGNKYGDSFGASYKNGDIISLKIEFDKKFGLLYFKKNEQEWKNAGFKIRKDKKVKIAVCLFSDSDGVSSLQLLFAKVLKKPYTQNNDEIEQKQNESINNAVNNANLQKMVNDLQQELLKKIDIIDKSEREIKHIQKQLDAAKEINARQELKIKNLQNQLKEDKMMKNDIEEQKKNGNDGDRLNEKGEEIKDDLKFLQEQLKQFQSDWTRNRLFGIYNKTPDSLLINDDMDGFEIEYKSFGKYLSDIKGYIESLTHPDITKYTQWNIDEMCQWISLLETGRFRKYLTVLRDGFKSDGIDSGEYLPDLDKNTLRNDPFQIQNFGDRRDLENHFMSLKSQQFVNDQQNDEGAPTAYI